MNGFRFPMYMYILNLGTGFYVVLALKAPPILDIGFCN